MPSAFLERLRQGHRTIRYPRGPAELPERFRGWPTLESSRCLESCQSCVQSCPTGAIAARPLRLDLGSCLLCGRCAASCTTGAIAFSRDHRLAAASRDKLLVEAGREPSLEVALDPARRRLLSRSLKLRQVSAGGCNACEADLAVLGTVGFDLGRFGIQFVASPRHADGVVVTGPVSANMDHALRETLAATPSPKVVIAVGSCAISGGPFAGSSAIRGGVPRDLAVDLFIPGCPPHPLTILDGLLRLLGRA